MARPFTDQCIPNCYKQKDHHQRRLPMRMVTTCLCLCLMVFVIPASGIAQDNSNLKVIANHSFQSFDTAKLYNQTSQSGNHGWSRAGKVLTVIGLASIGGGIYVMKSHERYEYIPVPRYSATGTAIPTVWKGVGWTMIGCGSGLTIAGILSRK